MIVWRIEYGSGPSVMEFDIQEAAEFRRRSNCQMDIQQYKSGLSRAYIGPVVWLSGSMTVRQIGGTLAKLRTLAALKTPVKIYYRYHLAPATYVYAYIVPQKTENYFAGSLLADELTVQWIETEEPS